MEYICLERKAFRHLTYTDRLKIETLCRTKTPKRVIAEVIGCSLSTIYNEIARGKYIRIEKQLYRDVVAYSADVAQQKVDYGHVSCGAPEKIGCRHDVCQQLSVWIMEGNSPAVCAQLLKQSKLGITLCTNTIYSYIKKGYIPNVTMRDCPEGGRRVRHGKVVKKPRRAVAGTSIERRPAAINKRLEPGHWEMDCVIGKSSGRRQALLTLTERVSRYEIIMRLERKDAKSVVCALDKLEKQFGAEEFRRIFLSITVDNGCEFSDVRGLEYSKNGNKRTQLYYCHPYASSERGMNERHNRIIRRFLPKGQSLFGVTQKDCDDISSWMNNYPRKVLDWATPAQLFSALFFHQNNFGNFLICS